LTANLLVDLLYGVVDPRIRFVTGPMHRLPVKG
jgi:ABC-type microcin C transport system permease subunit YejB